MQPFGARLRYEVIHPCNARLYQRWHNVPRFKTSVLHSQIYQLRANPVQYWLAELFIDLPGLEPPLYTLTLRIDST